MKIRVEFGNYYYETLVGHEFDVVEKLDVLHENIYIIKGKENETRGNWFRKKDCTILDEDYSKGIETLRLEERLEEYNLRLTDYSEKLKQYESDEYIEEYEGQKNILIFGGLAQISRTKGKIELLESLLGKSE